MKQKGRTVFLGLYAVSNYKPYPLYFKKTGDKKDIIFVTFEPDHKQDV